MLKINAIRINQKKDVNISLNVFVNYKVILRNKDTQNIQREFKAVMMPKKIKIFVIIFYLHLPDYIMHFSPNFEVLLSYLWFWGGITILNSMTPMLWKGMLWQIVAIAYRVVVKLLIERNKSK